jgi:competence protein ComEC
MPLFWFCLAAITGIFTASLCQLPLYIWISAALMCLAVGIFELFYFRNRNHPLLSRPVFRIPLALILCGFFLGGSRFQGALPTFSPDNLLWYVSDTPISLTGMIKSDPYRANNITSAVIKSESIEIDGKEVKVKGDLSLLLPAGFDIRYGDRLTLTGSLKQTFHADSLPITSRSAQQKLFVKMAFPGIQMISYGNGNKILDFLYRLRKRAHATIYNLMPFPESSVLSGILLGIESGIPDYLWNAYRASGTIHIIAISGFNISVIAIFISRSFRRLLGTKGSLAATISAIVFYTLLVGADRPVVRAAIMGIIALPAYQIGRRTIGIHNLTLAGFGMLMINPFLLWDISFQLSFMATLALLTLVKPIDSWIRRKLEEKLPVHSIDKIMPVVGIFTTTFSASVVIFPILFRMNAELSMTSLFANFLIAPLQPLIMALGGLAVLFGLVIPPIGNFFGVFAWPFVAFCDHVAIRLSMSDAAVIPLPDYVFWISLLLTLVVLTYSSYRQIFSFSEPQIIEREL